MYGINSILYQRGIYPPEQFTRQQKYGLTLLVSTDDNLKNYLDNIFTEIKGEYHVLNLFIIHHWSYTNGKSSNQYCVSSIRPHPYLSNHW